MGSPSRGLDIHVPGPGVLIGFISVRQVSAPAALSPTTNFGLSDEENFLVNFPAGGTAARYWAVGMSIETEEIRY